MQVIFKSTKQYTLDVLHITADVERIIKAIGNTMSIRTDSVAVSELHGVPQDMVDSLGSVLSNTYFELDNTPFSVLVGGDNAYGPVTQISVCNGHLILVAAFGDDGEMVFSPTAPCGEALNDLPAELIATMDEDSILADDTLFINNIDDYIVGQSFSCNKI